MIKTKIRPINKSGNSLTITLTGFAEVDEYYQISKDEQGIITLRPVKV